LVGEREVTLEEVNDAMWRCEGFKASGPDDFNFNFYIYIYIYIYKEWSFIGEVIFTNS
jgi:hypothetical protein